MTACAHNSTFIVTRLFAESLRNWWLLDSTGWSSRKAESLGVPLKTSYQMNFNGLAPSLPQTQLDTLLGNHI